MRSLPSLLRRRRRLLLWLAGLFAAYTLAGFFLAPIVVRQQAVKHAAAALRRPVTIDQVRINPLTCSLTVRGLAVAAHDGAEFAGWDELHVDFSPLASLGRLAWSFEEIHLVHPRARLYRDAAGALNIADLLPPATSEARSAGDSAARQNAPALPPPLRIATFELTRGEFTYADQSLSAPFETRFGPTSFALRNFTTRPREAGTYTFEATTEAGERFAWQGSLTFSPLGSAGRVAIAGLNLPKYTAFHRDLHQLDLLSGRLGVELDYELDLAGPAPVARLANGRVTLADLQLAARGTTNALATIPLVELSGLAADSAKQQATLATLVVRGATLSATRRADGTLDWLSLLAPAMAQSSVPAKTAPAPDHRPPATDNRSPVTGNATAAWSATLGTFELADATVRLHDLTNPRPVELVIDQLALKLTGASTRLDQPVALATSLRWGGAGRIALEGTVTPQPLAADLQLEVADLALRPLDPYLAPFADLRLTGGAARAKGHVTLALTADSAPDLRWQGEAGVSALAAVDGEFSEPLFGFADLALANTRATTQPLAVAIDEIALNAPYAHAIVFPDKRLNLTAILKTAAPAPAVAQASLPATSAAAPEPKTKNQKPETAAAGRPQIAIARVTLADARFVATDRSVSPAFTTELTAFGGTISGLSSAQLARAEVDLSGRLGLAPLKVSGQINPLAGDAFTDVKITFTGIELPPFTPYSGKFAGYTVDKGKLSVDLAYHLSARELAAENKVVLDQFFLGQPVESPEAVKLPLKLALAILRDRDGRIAIDLPIRGNLDDPDFRYGKMVMHTLGTLVVKAATAPFALLGGLFGGGHDLSAVDFASGSAEFTPEALARLDGLAKALTERPGLSLEISSQPQRELDLAGLRETQLEALLRARKLRALAATTAEPIDPATLQLTPEETSRHLAELHAERCPPVAASADASQPAGSTAAAPAIAGTTAGATPAPQTGNLVVRTFRRLFVDPTPAERAQQPAASGSARRPPATDNRQPDTGHRLPATDHRQPATGTPPAPTPEELRAQVLATIAPDDSAFAALAAQRAQRIQEYLLTQGRIEAARVFLAPAGVPPAAGATTVPRVVFNLR